MRNPLERFQRYLTECQQQAEFDAYTAHTRRQDNEAESPRWGAATLLWLLCLATLIRFVH